MPAISSASSRNSSKWKQVSSSPVPQLVETTPELVPRKKVKSSGMHAGVSGKSMHDLLPAVSITSGQSVVRGTRLSVSDDSAVDDADLSSHSLRRHGRALFVDDEALEASGEESEEESAEESATVGAASESIDACSNSSVEIVKHVHPHIPRTPNAVQVTALEAGMARSLRSKCVAATKPEVFLEDLPSPRPETRGMGRSSGMTPSKGAVAIRLVESDNGTGATISDPKPISAKGSSSTSPSLKSAKAKGKMRATTLGSDNDVPLFYPSDDDAPMTQTQDSPVKGEKAASSVNLASVLAGLLGDDVHDSSPEPDEEAPVLRAVLHPGLDVNEPADETLRVMQPHLMEEHLVTLGVSLVKAFKFKQYGAFVNLGHLNTSLLGPVGKTLHVGDTNSVCLAMGLVMECMLFKPGYQGSSHSSLGKCIRHLCIMPFHQWFHCESTMWGIAFDLEYMQTSALSDRGMSYVSHVEDATGRTNKNSKYSSTHSSPTKGSHWKTPAKTVSAATITPGTSYPSSLGFMDEVPIYDSRASAGSHFLFRPSDFALLSRLPRYTTSQDLDTFTLVTVGYSVSIWSGFNDALRVTPNILFVIVLGSMPKKETIAAHGLIE
ncbi:hypothetical protein ARMGADRAFT_1032546 [Armillaria gallica]|uniref:Uncharacterized protein n=1 Tax=Armillaria gallica TaxID=47427 RepID=A0A2H3DGG3_ARMGA|nr:hypothetical protein ARMGADRAFT_1032546 [Armillaria gallica]